MRYNFCSKNFSLSCEFKKIFEKNRDLIFFVMDPIEKKKTDAIKTR